MPEGAKYCPQCRQKNTDGRLTFRELLAQLAENIFSLDARIFQTIGALTIPGKLTESFFQGKHVRYYHPVRLFIFTGALMIAAITLTLPKDGVFEVGNGLQAMERKNSQKLLLEKLDSVVGQVKTTVALPESTAALDSVSAQIQRLEPKNVLDSIPLDELVIIGSPVTESPVALADVMALSPDSLCKKYHVTGLADRLALSQSIRVMRSPENFATYLIGNILWMMLIMMPMLALALKLVYVRRGYFYYEHLVFSFHIHTFIFLVIAVSVLIEAWLGDGIAPVGMVLSLVYPVLAQKRFYKQNWAKTIIKTLIVSVLYVFIFAMSFLAVTIVSAFLF